MPKTVNMQSDGTVNMQSDGTVVVNFGFDGSGMILRLGDPELPSQIASAIESAHDAMIQSGISQTHMEQSDFRTFTHIVKGGLVDYQPEIANPLFKTLMDAQALLEEAYAPPVPEPQPSI